MKLPVLGRCLEMQMFVVSSQQAKPLGHKGLIYKTEPHIYVYNCINNLRFPNCIHQFCPPSKMITVGLQFHSFILLQKTRGSGEPVSLT